MSDTIRVSMVPPKLRASLDGEEIGRIAAGTTVTPQMLAMMVIDHMNGEPPALYMDGAPGFAFTKVSAEVDPNCTFEIGTSSRAGE